MEYSRIEHDGQVTDVVPCPLFDEGINPKGKYSIDMDIIANDVIHD